MGLVLYAMVAERCCRFYRRIRLKTKCHPRCLRENVSRQGRHAKYVLVGELVVWIALVVEANLTSTRTRALVHAISLCAKKHVR